MAQLNLENRAGYAPVADGLKDRCRDYTDFTLPVQMFYTLHKLGAPVRI